MVDVLYYVNFVLAFMFQPPPFFLVSLRSYFSRARLTPSQPSSRTRTNYACLVCFINLRVHVVGACNNCRELSSVSATINALGVYRRDVSTRLIIDKSRREYRSVFPFYIVLLTWHN